MTHRKVLLNVVASLAMGDAIHGGNREKDEIAAHHIDFELAISINIQPMKDRRVNTIRKVIYTVEQADINLPSSCAIVFIDSNTKIMVIVHLALCIIMQIYTKNLE